MSIVVDCFLVAQVGICGKLRECRNVGFSFAWSSSHRAELYRRELSRWSLKKISEQRETTRHEDGKRFVRWFGFYPLLSCRSSLLSYLSVLRFFSVVFPTQKMISELKSKKESGENDECDENAINPA